MAERRKNLRKDYQGRVSLKINEFLKGEGYSKNISAGGVRVSSPELFTLLGEVKADQQVNKTMEVVFIDQSLTVKGTIIQVNAFSKEFVISVTQVSNSKTWNWLCKFAHSQL